jgi:hypothetical protein
VGQNVFPATSGYPRVFPVGLGVTEQGLRGWGGGGLHLHLAGVIWKPSSVLLCAIGYKDDAQASHKPTSALSNFLNRVSSVSISYKQISRRRNMSVCRLFFYRLSSLYNILNESGHISQCSTIIDYAINTYRTLYSYHERRVNSKINFHG